VKNLYVVDGAAFTTATEKNPTLTILALAWRARDHLAEQMRPQIPHPRSRLSYTLSNRHKYRNRWAVAKLGEEQVGEGEHGRSG
jgi:hypothetical protein